MLPFFSEEERITAMVGHTEFETWRDLLRSLIATTAGRNELAERSRIGKLTLRRWAYQDPPPHPERYRLKQFVEAVPEEMREPLLRLIRRDPSYVDFSLDGLDSDVADRADELMEGDDDEVDALTTVFYRRILSMVQTTAPDLRFRMVADLVLHKSLEILAPADSSAGVVVTVARCLPPLPGEQTVRCLYCSVEQGTFPWSSLPQPNLLLLGSESMAGYVVSTRRSSVAQNLREEANYLPVRLEAHEQSSVAYPLLRSQRVAGCLLVSSSQPAFFTAPRLAVIEELALLAGQAFHDTDYYAPSAIVLQPMPESAVQRPYFTSFRQRVSQAMRLTHSIWQAELQAWQEIAHAIIEAEENGEEH